MKQLIPLGIVFTTLGCTFEPKENDVNDHGHHHGHHQGGHERPHGSPAAAELIVATEPAEPVAGLPVTLKLMIHAADGKMVKDFDVVHEEKVHLVVVRDGLDRFAHIHPSVDAKGRLTITHTFPVGGRYRLFADYAPTGGGHATALGSVFVAGDSPPAPSLIVNAPGDVEADGLRASVSAEPLKAGQATRVAFALADENGGSAQLEPFMGALGHLMFVSAAGRYVHVHPVLEDATAGKVEFEAHFPEPGLYKGWGQFQQDGQVRVVPFVVDVR